MSEMDYKPNSYAYKEKQKREAEKSEKKVEKVVKGTVKTKKKGEISKLADVFIAEDAKTVRSYLFTDVVIPSVINLVEDLAIKGIRMLLRGDAGRSGRNSVTDYVSYRDYSRGRDSRRSEPARARSSYRFDDIILESRGEADEVLSQLDSLIETYGYATIADLNDLLGRSGEYTDNKYGWTNLRSADAVRTRDGYMLKLPKATVI